MNKKNNGNLIQYHTNLKAFIKSQLFQDSQEYKAENDLLKIVLSEMEGLFDEFVAE